MKLQKFTLIGGSPILLNTSMILSSEVFNRGISIITKYPGNPIPLVIEGGYSDFISSLSNNSKYNVELLTLKVLSRGELIIDRYMAINLNYVYLCENHPSGSRLICDGAILGISTPVYFVVEHTLDEIVSAQIPSGATGGIRSMELGPIEVVEGNTLVTHNAGAKLKALFIYTDNTWQSWPFNFGVDDTALNETDQLNKVYIPYGEAGSINLSLIF